MSVSLGAFLLGNAVILGNLCVLPLYPELIAFLAGNVEQGRPRGRGILLGACVLAGVLLVMISVGFVLFAIALFGFWVDVLPNPRS